MPGRLCADRFVNPPDPQTKNAGDGIQPTVQRATTAAAKGTVFTGTGLKFHYLVGTGHIAKSHFRTGALAEKALPWARRHWLQWHSEIGPRAPSYSNLIAPHRH